MSLSSDKIIASNSTGEASLQAEVGDKVRLKKGPNTGARGVVEALENGKLVVRAEGTDRPVRVLPEEVTNYSLAARKAWVTGPNRRVGRRKGTRLADRVSVTLRLDRELWERFQRLEEAGAIRNRTVVINGWLREKVDELEAEERGS
jgi:hypothetical protein